MHIKNQAPNTKSLQDSGPTHIIDHYTGFQCVNLNLNFCSAKPLLGHRSLVWLVGFMMTGFMGGVEKYRSVLGRVEVE